MPKSDHLIHQLYARLCEDLVQGRTLSPEDHIDLLTLKDNFGDDGTAYFEALEAFVRAKV